MRVARIKVVFIVIVIAQFFGTSLWFAGNAILPQLQALHQWPKEMTGWITSSTQIGFIVGTLVFALIGLADRFSPSRIFFICSLLAAVSNAIILIHEGSMSVIFLSRGLVGFFLAGIYPIGMKIAADWQERGLGNWLGSLVGALVIGTSLPFALRAIGWTLSVEMLVITISLLCALGGSMVGTLVPNGPYRKFSGVLEIGALWTIFKEPSFRAASLGYFGHMWELYALWAFLPSALAAYGTTHSLDSNVPLLTFAVIGAGGIGCYAGGRLSMKYGSQTIATASLAMSGVCCLLSPFYPLLSPVAFVAFFLVWGIAAAADSPQFSALVARFASSQHRGSAITLIVCIGFIISVITIQMLSFLQSVVEPRYLFIWLAPGPVFGVISMLRNKFSYT